MLTLNTVILKISSSFKLHHPYNALPFNSSFSVLWSLFQQVAGLPLPSGLVIDNSLTCSGIYNLLNPIHKDSNTENRAASRILEIRILIKDCDFFLFERLRILKIWKLKRSFN